MKKVITLFAAVVVALLTGCHKERTNYNNRPRTRMEIVEEYNLESNCAITPRVTILRDSYTGKCYMIVQSGREISVTTVLSE